MVNFDVLLTPSSRMRCFALCILFTSLMMATTACKPPAYEAPIPDPSDPNKTGGTSTLPQGIITGFVILHDEFGLPKPDNSGVIVSLEGELTAFPAPTRPEGRFIISNVFAGPYNLSYNKKGYGNFKRIGISHAGGNNPTTVPPLDLWETPQTVVQELSVQVNGLALTFQGVTMPIQPVGVDTTQQRRVRLFLGRDERVNHLNYVSTPKQILVPAGGRGAFTLKLSADELSSFGAGNRIYAVAYGITAIENAYVDPDTKRTVFAGINPAPSNVVSFVLP